MKQKRWSSYATIITPLDQQGHPSEDMVRKQLQWIRRTDIEGVFVASSTGECMNFTEEENIQQMIWAKEELNDSKQLVFGASATNADTSIRYLEAGIKLGYQTAVVCPPYYASLSQQEIICFYQEILETSFPLTYVLYNVPQFTNEMTLETITQLAEHPKVIGAKESSGNMTKIAHMAVLSQGHREFSVYSGTDDFLYPALSAGLQGNMTALSGLLPEAVLGVRTAYNLGDRETAEYWHNAILKITAIANQLTFPLGYKLIAKCRGLSIGKPRQSCSSEEINRVTSEMDAALDVILGERKIVY